MPRCARHGSFIHFCSGSASGDGACQIHETAERLELLPRGPGAKVEWQRLSVLLRLLSCATAHWGKPECMYGLDRLRVEQKIRELKAK